MSTDSTPHAHHSDDATADDGPPTDAFTDEVRADAAAADDDDEGSEQVNAVDESAHPELDGSDDATAIEPPD